MSKRHYKRYLIPYARELRHNATGEEKKLWYIFLSKHPCKFRRQAPMGDYVVDFYCPDAKLIIEIDGVQHWEPENKEKDRLRTDYLEQSDNLVIRFSNYDINRYFDGVCEAINQTIDERLGTCFSKKFQFERDHPRY